MSLTFVAPTQRPWQYLNIILYGEGGVGKSTGALSAPGPVLVLNAEGPNGIQFARERYGNDHVREVAVSGGPDLNEALLYLREPDHGIRTVVLDSVAAAYDAVLDCYAGGGKPTLPQHGDTTTALLRFAKHLRDMPVNVVLVAHERPVQDEVEGGFERLPFTGTKNPDMGIRLMRMYDIVGYCGRVPPDDKHPDERYIAQVVPGAGRRGKDRTARLGEFQPLNISRWLEICQSQNGNGKGQ